MNIQDISSAQQTHYRKLLAEHAGTPMAVSSESLSHKNLRFREISRVFDQDKDFTLHDVGMGLGAFCQYLRDKHPETCIEYSGSDILHEFVVQSKKQFPDCQFYCRDIAEKSGTDTYDYVVMSGVFHQRREATIPDWEKFSYRLLRNCWPMCRKGMAFNFISPFVDFYQTDVYYANLAKLLGFITDDLSRFFVVNHNYALYEFTVCVYKEEYIRQRDSEPEFLKYFRTKCEQ